MLAIQKIRIVWDKKDRTPEGAAERQKYLGPFKIKDSVCLEGDGIFINHCDFIQDTKVYDYDVYFYEMSEFNAETSPVPYDSFRRSLLHNREYRAVKDGIFTDDPRIPSIIVTQEDGAYRIKWHSLINCNNCYRPIRHGHNEDFNNRKSQFCGMNVTCETAFILNPGESGVIEYNYRYSHETQHYERYCVYFVNTDKLDYNTFTKADYKNKYDQTVVLF